jgi:3-oxoacyl-[acyl-carrier protein] reductase
MKTTFLFAGASSAMAVETAKLLQAEGYRVIGLSTKEKTHDYDEFYKMEKYRTGFFPQVDSPLHGAVYFPGSIRLKPFKSISEADMMYDYEINALGAVAFAQAYMDQLKKTNQGTLVFVSSVAAQAGLPFHASIAMAKGALESLTKTLAAEYAPAVRVNSVAPSLTETPMADRLINTPEKAEAFRNRNPLRKIGTPSDIAHVLTFLLTERSGWITGQIIHVDGGMTGLKI